VREEPVREERVAEADDADVDEPRREPPVATGAGDGEGDGAEMIRSEEEVEVGTRRRVAGKARLKKYVVTEHVQRTIPVQREEVRVEYEPAEGEDGERAEDVSRDRAE
jgi:stress response protein YsnF